MPRIINTFSSNNPLASTIKSLGDSFFGDQVTPALKKQQLMDAQRETSGIEELARTMGAATDGNVNFNRAAESAVLGGLKPEDVAMFTNYLAGNITGPRSTQTTNAMAGAGKFGDSAENLDLNRSNAFNMNAADNAQSGVNNKYSTDVGASTSIANNTADNVNSMAQFQQKPIEATINGQPGFVPQGQAATMQGAAPILNETQVAPLDAFKRQLLASELMFPGDPERARSHAIAQLSKTTSKGMTVFGPDGSPIVEMGGSADGSVGPLTNANTTKQQADLINTNQFKTTVDMADKLLDANPGAVGAQGNLKHGFQSASILVKGLTDSLGYPDIQTAWADTQAQALAMGVKPETLSLNYDPSFAEIGTLYNIMTFQAVKAIGQQSGNDASNRDFAVIKETLGDPKDWLTNAQDLKTRLKIVKNYVDLKQKQTRQTLGLPAVDPTVANPIPQPNAPTAGGYKVLKVE